jgi:hypothetical protein
MKRIGQCPRRKVAEFRKVLGDRNKVKVGTPVEDSTVYGIGAEGQRLDWDSMDWESAERQVTRLRQRIYRATCEQKWNKVRSLMKLMLRSRSNLLLSVRRVTQKNKGKGTPGIDGKVALTNKARVTLIRQMEQREFWKARPSRRIYIPKVGKPGQLRPLSIPTLGNRIAQAIIKNALEPSWEARFEAHSYGFRPGRSCHDAIRLASINYPNGQTTNFSWYGTAQDERLQGITNLTPSGQTRSQFNYAYDSAGEITQWPQQNAGISPASNSLGYDPAGQLVSAQSGFGSPPSPAVNQNYYGYDAAANRTSSQSSSIQTARIAGTVTSGNVLTITVQDPSLSGGQEIVNYTVLSTDTLATIATNLAAAITADANLQTLGVNASATSTLLKIRSTSPNITTYTSSTSGGATETITLGVSSNIVQNATVNLVGINYQTRASDVLKINVFDSGLSGGTVSVSYTVPSNNTAIATVAAGLASAINANSSLSTLGVTATSASGVVSISSSSTNLTTYSSAVTPTTTSGTETVTVGTNTVGNTTATIGGTVTVGDIVSLTVRANALTGGSESVACIVPSGATTTTIATALKD